MNAKPARGKGARSTTATTAVKRTLPTYTPNFGSLFDNLLEGCMLISFDWIYLYLNEAAARHGHGKREHLLGRSMLEAYPGVEKTEIFAHYREVMQQRTPQRFEASFTFAEGALNWYELSVEPAVEGILVLSMDITQRKLTEAALLESEQKFNTAFHISPVGMIISHRDDGTFLELNDELLRINGYTRSEMLGQSSLKLGLFETPELRQKLADQRVLRDVEVQLKHRSGERRWVSLSSQPIRLKGEDCGLTIVRDIHEMKLMQDELRQSEAKFRGLFEHAHDALMVFDPSRGRYTAANPASLQMFGAQSEAELITYAPWELSPEFQADGSSSRARTGEMIATVLHAGHTFFEWTHRRLDGTEFPADVLLVRVETRDGPILQATIRDITERKRVEQALRMSEEKYRGLVQSLDNPVALIDRQGRYLYMNDIAARRFGGTAGEMVGKSMFDLFPEPVARQQMASLQRVFEEDAPLSIEEQIVVQGQPYWYRVTIQPIHDEAGNVAYALINATDIHALKTAQEELQALNHTLEQRVQERTAQVQDLYDHAPVGYHSLDVEGRFVAINQTALDWLGYTPEELLGRPIKTIYTPASAEKFEAEFAQFKATGGVRNLDFEVIRKDGTTFPVLINATAIYDPSGHYVSSRSTMTDITEQKRAETALREREAQNRLLFDESPVPVVLLNAAGVVVRANRAFQEITGLALEQVSGRTARELQLLPPGGYDRLRDLLQQGGRSGRGPVAAEFSIRGANDSQIEVASRVFPFILNGSEHFYVTLIDISIYRITEELLRQANAEMEQAMRMKDDFLANMSHELRTPLTGILGITENMLAQVGGPLTERQRKYLEMIGASGSHLLALINEILDLSKIEAGKLELQLQNLNAEEICQSSLVFIKEPALKKQVEVTYHCEPETIFLVGDARRLKQILINLLSNAVKFTPAQGRVSLNVQADPQLALVRFEVVDTGIGISAQDLTRLFKPFTQVDSGLSRQYEGTGLGLALVKKLTEMHGGAVRVESEPGQGSRFSVIIPWRRNLEVNAAPTGDATPISQSDRDDSRMPRRKRILLAEDNEINAMVAGDYLEAGGYEVAWAADGAVVLSLAPQFHPDLVLMDIQLPVMNGLEAIRQLRQIPEFQTTPIIALTALAMKGDRERCLAAGADEYLPKPFSLPELAQKIELMINLR